ncbi:uncharacterized protein LOC116135452 [Pistacia vera]|uniref:uncharacterized protein LOC116135452 n=1 Tax=Pistacia vera TaxID=55513 RepID=UPI001263C34F|nr:uncharacterized protein LOC116135452 [Pistacia vera]XP_031277020.1 uncharacterized protein LOC116135452 [Pistacia vera]
MTEDTTSLSYWLNSRVFLCALWILFAIVSASVIIWKYEGSKKSKSDRRGNKEETVGSLYEDQAWNTCLTCIHPAWLLLYRVIAFTVLFALITANIVTAAGGVDIFFFYTQWTFALVTIYFGLGSSMSIYGLLCKSHSRVDDDGSYLPSIDAEQHHYIPPMLKETADVPNTSKGSNTLAEPCTRKTAGVWGYAFQIIFQMCAGAVILTDIVFWLVLYPFLLPTDIGLNLIVISMHSVNAVVLVGDVILNDLRFPLFRIAYYILWTCTFVIFQWIIHACSNLWWPYAFLDLSSPWAPVWYLGVGLLHVPCFGVFAALVRLKHFVLSKSFPDSYRC